MRSSDCQVLSAALNWLRAGEAVWLCTIVRAVGSSPRPVGSMLVCNSAGEQVGSLSGGCIEEDLLLRLQEQRLPSAPTELLEYGVSALENERLGLPCGGRLEVLLQPLTASTEQIAWLETVVNTLAQRRCIRRRVDLRSGQTQLSAACRFAPLEIEQAELQQSFGPQMRLLLIGAGQLSQTLAELAQAMDYEIIINDPREAMRRQWSGATVTMVEGMPDDAVRKWAADDHSVVITLTHDPRIDDMALMEALASKAWYVGALGSVRTTQKRLPRLRQLGLSEQQIGRLHAPVGLAIGSKTPMEIAVAIAAQLTQLRRRGEE